MFCVMRTGTANVVRFVLDSPIPCLSSIRSERGVNGRGAMTDVLQWLQISTPDSVSMNDDSLITIFS